MRKRYVGEHVLPHTKDCQARCQVEPNAGGGTLKRLALYAYGDGVYAEHQPT